MRECKCEHQSQRLAVAISPPITPLSPPIPPPPFRIRRDAGYSTPMTRLMTTKTCRAVLSGVICTRQVYVEGRHHGGFKARGYVCVVAVSKFQPCDFLASHISAPVAYSNGHPFPFLGVAMETYSCHYDCDQPPSLLSSNPDISGIGVSLAYSITAGLAVATVLSYYVLAYRPDLRPKNSSDGGTGQIKSNRIDEFVLHWKLKLDKPRDNQQNGNDNQQNSENKSKQEQWQEALKNVKFQARHNLQQLTSVVSAPHE